MARLSEKYRPASFETFVGQPKALEKVRRLIDRPDFDGDAFWIVGPSGTGKTSLGRLIAQRFAMPLYVYELDGEACTVDAVREVADQMMYGTLDGGFKVWLVNEAQAMTPKAVQAWLTVLEKMPAKRLVIFTTTADSENLFGEYEGPFRSRCKTIEFTNQSLADAFAQRAQEIAQAEGLDGKPLADYKRLVQRCRNNFRAVLQAIESGDMID